MSEKAKIKRTISKKRQTQLPLKINIIIKYTMEPNDYNIPPAYNRLPLTHKNLNTLPLSQQSKKSCQTLHRTSIQSIKKSAAEITRNKQNQQCTFEPKTNERGKGKRSLDHFFKDQQHFLLSKEQKIQMLRQEINRSEDQQNTGRPSIDSNSKLLAAMSNSNTNIYQRLSKQRQIQPSPSDQNLFSPKILHRSKSITRKHDVSTLLYEDAKRRQEKDQSIIECERKQIDMMMSPKINSNTNALVRKKILAQFAAFFSEDTDDMNPLIALSILSEIFNVDLNPNKSSANSLLVKKLMKYIAEPNDSSVVTVARLWNFINIAINGSLETSCFTEEQEKKIHEQFQYLYKERMTKERKESAPQLFTFKPTILAKSTKLATVFRDKAYEKVQNFIQNQKLNIQLKKGPNSMEQLFVADYLKKQTQNQQKRIQKQNKQLQKCTFKPDVSPSASSLNLLKKKPKVTLKVSKRQPHQKTQCTQKTQQDQQDTSILLQSKMQPSLSHQKNTHKSTQKINKKQLKNVKNIDKIIMRMSAGRQKRQFSNQLMERGYPEGYNWTSYQRQMHRQSIQNCKKLQGLTTN